MIQVLIAVMVDAVLIGMCFSLATLRRVMLTVKYRTGWRTVPALSHAGTALKLYQEASSPLLKGTVQLVLL
jgi:hypothetical protein